MALGNIPRVQGDSLWNATQLVEPLLPDLQAQASLSPQGILSQGQPPCW